jgi:hypothetical protein
MFDDKIGPSEYVISEQKFYSFFLVCMKLG